MTVEALHYKISMSDFYMRFALSRRKTVCTFYKKYLIIFRTIENQIFWAKEQVWANSLIHKD